jgi:hypothetical protein
MARSAPIGQEPKWAEIRAELFSATSHSLSPEVERLLLSILRFEGELQLDESSEMPHRMSPESMLKSLAVQVLVQATGVLYLPTLRRIEATATPAVSNVIRAVIQKATSKVTPSPSSDTGVVPTLSKNVGATVTIRQEDMLHKSVNEVEQNSEPQRRFDSFVRDFGMTRMLEERGVMQRAWHAQDEQIRGTADGSVRV